MESARQKKSNVWFPLLLGLAIGLTVCLIGLLRERCDPVSVPSNSERTPTALAAVRMSTVHDVPELLPVEGCQQEDLDNETLGHIHLLAAVGVVLGDDPRMELIGMMLGVDPDRHKVLDQGIDLLRSTRWSDHEIADLLPIIREIAELREDVYMQVLIDLHILLLRMEQSSDCMSELAPAEPEYY